MNPVTTSFDLWIHALDHGLRCLSGSCTSSRVYPPSQLPEGSDQPLSPQDRAASGALMRVNHVGEVCAQALYMGQALSSTEPQSRQFLEQARKEETDHLVWTRQRLHELGSRPSLLNPVWFAGAFAMGWVAGQMGEPVSLGFVRETERQVEAHLGTHMERLPPLDLASKAIVHQMAQDEAAHGAAAAALGGKELPQLARALMQITAKIMTTVAHRV